MSANIEVFEYLHTGLSSLYLSFGETQLSKLTEVQQTILYNDNGVLFTFGKFSPQKLDKDGVYQDCRVSDIKILMPKKAMKVDFARKENFYIMRPKSKYDVCKQCNLYIYVDNNNVKLKRHTKLYDKTFKTDEFESREIYTVYSLGGRLTMGKEDIILLEYKEHVKEYTEFGKRVNDLADYFKAIKEETGIQVMDTWKIPALLKVCDITKKDKSEWQKLVKHAI